MPVLKKIHDAGKGIIGMKLVGAGKYRNDPEKREASFRYVLGLGCIDVVVIGLEQPEEIAEQTARQKALEA